MIKPCVTAIVACTLCVSGGCGETFGPRPAPLFTTPLSINGEPVGRAVIDTGGGYEVILQSDFGLNVVDSARVLAFGGSEIVGVTEGFPYVAGGWAANASSALIGVSVCDCNGLGFEFFRNTGAVLLLDFSDAHATFVATVPQGGVTIPFAAPPRELSNFHTSFVEVEVSGGGVTRCVSGLLDTGTNATVIRRGLVGGDASLTSPRSAVTVYEPHLGTVALHAALFDTEGLPDIIIGTDVLGAWSDRWYFSYRSDGGEITAFPRDQVVSVGSTQDRRSACGDPTVR
ncbi:MAG: hypothetical protein ACE5EX_12220 [Phycisphaerae bacterium]